ncbi:MAG: RHS repeat-associated core domain-containing protein [Clostridia bacterium]|nr:RHS repeat-associated core domain-containing protein [Clostridia bacterium]
MREYAGTQLNGNTLLSSVKYNYEDKTNRLSAIVRNSLLGTQEISFVYGNLTAKQNPDAVYTVKHNGTPVLNYNYDPLGRLLTRTIAPINKTQSFTYKQGGHCANSTSALVESVTTPDGSTEYSYDANGNITAIYVNGSKVADYGYDHFNQLVEYVDANGQVYNYIYTNGNIEYIKLNGETIKTFSYTDPNWPDKLTAVNGNTMVYDAIGNPLTYHDGKVFTWENGRRLATVTKGANSYSYTYDGNGIRTSKNVNGTLTEFIYADGVLIGQTTEDDTLVFLYDESGNKFGFIYNGAYYYYDINLQGDVVGIYNSNGVKVVTYEYDPWGVITNITDTSGIDIGTINPIRYRGYYYDNETGFYLTGTRYYDPEIGRFINADNQIAGIGSDIRGYNLFAYCFNNPVNMSDPTGNWPRWITATVTIVAAVVTVVAVATGNIAVASVAAKITIAAGATYIAQSAHYDRRETKNDVATLPQSPQEAKDSGWRGPDTTPKGPAADCHQYTAKDGPNKKYVSPDGHREVIYNSQNKIVLDARDIGTYNFCPSNELWYSNQSIGHLIHDIIPWVIFGNSDDDPGWVANEIIRLFE